MTEIQAWMRLEASLDLLYRLALNPELQKQIRSVDDLKHLSRGSIQLRQIDRSAYELRVSAA